MYVFTARYCLRLIETGDCYDVWCGDVYLGTVCVIACSIEYDDEMLWGETLAHTPKRAAIRLAVERMAAD